MEIQRFYAARTHEAYTQKYISEGLIKQFLGYSSMKHTNEGLWVVERSPAYLASMWALEDRDIRPIEMDLEEALEHILTTCPRILVVDSHARADNFTPSQRGMPALHLVEAVRTVYADLPIIVAHSIEHRPRKDSPMPSEKEYVEAGATAYVSCRELLEVLTKEGLLFSNHS